jgi:16S rRNA (guanine527-N7)-methyltransferase
MELLRLALRPGRPASVVDVGPGGGYPGMVIAAVLDDTPVALVEPLQKRARLLQAMATELGLSNVTVHPVRAEDAGRGPLRQSAALVTARAVAPMAELLEYTVPLAVVGGLVALAKGSGLPAELDAARYAMTALGCSLVSTVASRPEISATLTFALLRKDVQTPEQYPRRAGLPAKRPLQNG